MEVSVASAESASSDDLRALWSELVRGGHWPGRVELVERAPDPGTLGPVLEALRVVAEPGALAALVTAVVTWVRYRSSDIDLKVTVAERSKTVVLSGKRLRRIDTAALTGEIEQLCRQLDVRPSAASDAADANDHIE